MGLLIFVGGGMVGIMSDFELLSLVLMILAIIIPLLIAYIKQRNNRRVPNKDWRLFQLKF